MLQITTKTVERLKQRFIEEGFEFCMDRNLYPEVKVIKTDGDFEAHLVATRCSKEVRNTMAHLNSWDVLWLLAFCLPL